MKVQTKISPESGQLKIFLLNSDLKSCQYFVQIDCVILNHISVKANCYFNVKQLGPCSASRRQIL